jgi:hypothetical protein
VNAKGITMFSLCDSLRLEISSSFPNVSTVGWNIEASDPDSCQVRTDSLLIIFTLDSRDKILSSSITYIGEPEQDQERLYTYIIYKLFPDLDWIDTYALNLSGKISGEVKNVKNLLGAIDKNGVSPRDLLYFFLGYNCAYTDHYT